jgi:hypothetical protein
MYHDIIIKLPEQKIMSAPTKRFVKQKHSGRLQWNGMFLATGGAGRAHGPSLPLPFKKKLGLINISSSKSEISNLFFNSQEEFSPTYLNRDNLSTVIKN